MTESKETRSFICEVRAEQNEEHGTYIIGTPIVYEQKTDMGWYEEVIDARALDDCDLKDVRFLVGHNTQGIPLARSRNNNEHSTMQLIPRMAQMDVRADLDIENNVEAKALWSASGRGEISGMSFIMIVDRDKDVAFVEMSNVGTGLDCRQIALVRRGDVAAHRGERIR